MIAIVLLAGLPSIKANAQQAAPAVGEVKIDNFSFAPGMLTVAVGTTVTWTNRDDIPHTVVSADGVFKPKARRPGSRPGHTSVHPGTVSAISPKYRNVFNSRH